MDTGYVGRDSGALDFHTVTGLEKRDAFRTVGQRSATSAAGKKNIRVGQSKNLTVGEFVVPNPVFSDERSNILGLGFLSRFKITFDFPNKAMYLQKGARFDSPDLWDLSGLHLVRKKGQTLVDSVLKDSAAATRGIQVGDILATLGNRKVEDLSLFEIRRLCSQSRSTLDLTIEREGKLYSAKVVLKQ